jgi:hypothetical protein
MDKCKDLKIQFTAHQLEDGTILVEIPKDSYFVMTENSKTIFLATVENIGIQTQDK